MSDDNPFKTNTYFGIINSRENYDTKEKLITRLKEHRFHYADVKFKEFKKLHKTNGQLGRKFIALAAAPYCILKAIGNLAIAILLTPTLLCGGKPLFLNSIYKVPRDLQASFGWLVTIFWDKGGQFHVQESNFQKTCYSCYF